MTYVEKERSKAEKLMASLFDAHAPAAGAWLRTAMGLPTLPAPVTEAQRELGWLMQVNARSTLPTTAHVHCLCTAP